VAELFILKKHLKHGATEQRRKIKEKFEPLAKVFHSWFDKLTTNGISAHMCKVRSP